jgi:phosphatidate cytidylyltransferase
MTMPADVEPPADQATSKPELAQRVVAAAILVPIVLVCAWAGGIWFALLVALVVGVGGYEWSRLCNIDRGLQLVLLAAVGPLVAIALTAFGFAAGLVVLLAAAAIAVFASWQNGPLKRVWPLAGIVYLGIPTAAIVILRAHPQFGLPGIFFLFAVVWVTDIGAYAVGRTIGGPRLAPSISPGKTWAGAFGGLFLAVAGTYLVAAVMGSPRPFGAIALAIYLSVATQCGDLFESWVKRRFGKKDSGTLIPGHGGVLDRIDGLLFAAPVMAAVTYAKSGAEPLWP